MSDANKEILRRVCEVFSNGDVRDFDNLVSPQMVDHNPGPGQVPGPQGLKDMANMFRSAFPDLNIAVNDLIAEGDKVVARLTVTGTNKGEFMGSPATNKQVSFQEVHICRIANGKIVEHWGLEDSMGMMQQLGVLPAMT